MKKVIFLLAVMSFVFFQGIAQTYDSISRSLKENSISDNIDEKYLAFNTTQNFDKLLKNPMENKDFLKYPEKSLLNTNDKIQGFVTPAPLDNMPVLRPLGNFPNRNYLPDPRHRYHMPVQRPELIRATVIGK